MNVEHHALRLRIRRWKLNLSINAARTQQRGVETVDAVRRHDDLGKVRRKKANEEEREREILREKVGENIGMARSTSRKKRKAKKKTQDKDRIVDQI